MRNSSGGERADWLGDIQSQEVFYLADCLYNVISTNLKYNTMTNQILYIAYMKNWSHDHIPLFKISMT